MLATTGLIEIARRDHIARLCVAAIIATSDDRILFCKRSMTLKVAPGLWHMPGGGIEEGETVEEAITRELSEELGLSVREAAKFSGVQHDYPAGGETHRTLFVYVVAEGSIVLCPENDEAGLFSLEQLSEILMPNVSLEQRSKSYSQGVLDCNIAAFRHGLSHQNRSRIVLP